MQLDAQPSLIAVQKSVNVIMKSSLQWIDLLHQGAHSFTCGSCFTLLQEKTRQDINFAAPQLTWWINYCTASEPPPRVSTVVDRWIRSGPRYHQWSSIYIDLMKIMPPIGAKLLSGNANISWVGMNDKICELNGLVRSIYQVRGGIWERAFVCRGFKWHHWRPVDAKATELDRFCPRWFAAFTHSH